MKNRVKREKTKMILVSYIIFALQFWFFFFLVNHSLILKKPREWVYSKLPSQMVYPLSCAFCSAFWFTTILFLTGINSYQLVLVSPVIVLFLELAFLKLTEKEISPVIKNQSDTHSPNSIFIISETSNDIQTR